MDKVLDAPGETKSFVDVLKALADRLGLEKFYLADSRGMYQRNH